MTEVQNASPRHETWGTMRVMLAPGELLVSREGPAIAGRRPGTPGQDATVDGLLELSADGDPHRVERRQTRWSGRPRAALGGRGPDDVPPSGWSPSLRTGCWSS